MAKVLGFTINIQGTEAAIESATDLKLAIQEINKQLKDPALTKPQGAKLEKQLIDLKARQKEVNAQVRESITQRRAEFKITENSVGAYRKLSQQLNTARARMKDLAAAGKTNTAEFKKVSKEVGVLDTKLKKIDASAGQFQRSVGNYSSALKGAFGAISKTLSFAGIALGVQELTRALKDSVVVFSEYTRQISFLGAVSGATEKELAALEAQSRKLGETTQFSASQVAQLQIEYSKIGFTASETLAATAPTLNLASVALTDLGETAQSVGGILRGFKLDASETERVTDVMGAAFTGSKLDLQKFTIAMSSVAPVANSLGYSLEETTAYVATLVDASVDASTAGTGLRNNMLLSAKAGLTLEEAMVEIENAAVPAVKAMELFGTRGALVGTELTGAKEKTDDFNKALEQSAGFTKEAGDAVTNDLKGAFDAFKSSVEGLQIRFGEAVEGLVLGATNIATSFIRGIGGAFEYVGELLSPLVESFRGLFDQFRQGEEQTGLLGKAAEFVGNTLRFVGESVRFVINTIAFLIKQASKVIATFREFSEGNTILGNAIKLVSGLVGDLIEGLGKIPAFFSGILAAANQLRENIVNLNFSKSIAEAFEEGFDRVVISAEEANRKLEEQEKTRAEKQKERDEVLAKEKTERAKKFAEQQLKIQEEQRRKDEAARKKAAEKEYKARKKQQAKEAAKAEKQRLAALKKERQDVAKQLSTIKLLRDDTIRTINQLTGEVVKATVEQVDYGLGIAVIGESIEARSLDILNRIKNRTEKQRKENRASAEEEKQYQEDVAAARIEITETSLNAGFTLLSQFQQRAAEQATAAIDLQVEKQSEKITALNDQIADSSGIQKEILQQRLAEEEKALEATNAKKEAIQKDFARREKRLNIIQSIIQTALGVARALAGPPPFPLSIPQAVAAGVQGAAQTAIIAAQPLATGGIITGRRVTDRQNIPTLSNGDNVLATVRRGEVVLNGRQQAALGGASTFRALGVPGFAAGGAISAPISAPQLPALQQTGQKELMELLKRMDAKTDAINGRIDRLRTYVVSEDVSNDLAEGEAIKTQATFE